MRGQGPGMSLGSSLDRPASRHEPLRIGLTGNIGAGKSSVAKLLADHGAAVVDADALARAATEDPAVLKAIAAELGPDLVITAGDGEPRLDRAATAARVFDDDRALARLNALIHPWVRRRSAELVAELERSERPPPVIVFDIPLLYENDLHRGLDAVVVVDAPLSERVARVVARSGLEPAAVRRRDAAQLPLEQKVARADFVVDNTGDEIALVGQVALLWRDLLGLRGEASVQR